MGPPAQHPQGVCPQAFAIQVPDLTFFHNLVSYAEYTGKWLRLTAPVDFREPLETEKTMDKNGLSAFLLGLGVGVGIGMLFAPKSGQETRALIKNKTGEGTEYIKQRGAEVKQTAAEWVDKGKEALSRQKDTLNEAVEAGKQAYRDVVS
jgi:gas vesicle protein